MNQVTCIIHGTGMDHKLIHSTKFRHSTSTTVKVLLVTIFGLMIVGCASTSENYNKFQPCSTGWFSQVEKKITTGDDQGHGPDPGSLEWRSVIEFKLGIRNSSKVPSLDTQQWCIYIHQNYIKPTK